MDGGLNAERAGFAVGVHFHRNHEAAAALAKEVRAKGGSAVTVSADLSRPGTGEQVVAETLSAFGRLDALGMTA